MLAVIREYIDRNKLVNLAQLQDIFPSNLQGTYKIIENRNLLDQSKHSRYFMNDPIILNSEELVVCTQWSLGNIEAFIKQATNLGLQITEETKTQK